MDQGYDKVGIMNRHLLWIALLVTVAAAALPAPDVQAATIAEIVGDNPVNWTPDVLDGQVEAIAQVGDRIIIGGTFTQVEDNAGVHARSRIAAFDATTGAVDPGFHPALDGAVKAIVPAGDGTSVFVTGGFNTVDGVIVRRNLGNGVCRFVMPEPVVLPDPGCRAVRFEPASRFEFVHAVEDGVRRRDVTQLKILVERYVVDPPFDREREQRSEFGGENKTVIGGTVVDRLDSEPVAGDEQ